MKVVQFFPHALSCRCTEDILIVSASVLPMLDFVLRTEFRQVKHTEKKKLFHLEKRKLGENIVLWASKVIVEFIYMYMYISIYIER